MLRVAGSALLIATAAIHLDLYLTGYRTIPTIGWLFLLQVIAAFGLALAVLAIPRRLVIPSRLAAAAGAGFALATLGGYLLSVWTGLFGFTEVRTTAGIAAGVVEVAAFAVLAALALAPAAANTPAGGAAAAPATFPAQISPAITRAAAMAAGQGEAGGRPARQALLDAMDDEQQLLGPLQVMIDDAFTMDADPRRLRELLARLASHLAHEEVDEASGLCRSGIVAWTG
jgi:hypothetical protein